MENVLDRSLTVFADGEPVTGFRHARLAGRDALGLYPMPFTLRVWNPAESDYHLLRGAKELSVRHGDSVLAWGSVSDVCRKVIPEGTLTEVAFAAGLGLWEAPVSLGVEAGVSVSETVRRILEASGTGIPLLSFPGEDPVRTRAQAFFGRAAECIEEALSGRRGYLTGAGLCVVPEGSLPVSMELSSADLLNGPIFVREKRMLLWTRVIGWSLGKMIRVKGKDGSWEGLVLERSVDADNLEGKWESEILAETEG